MGFGQIIKAGTIKLRPFDDLEFCSKVSTSAGTVDSWNIYRNPLKTLLKKQYYYKKHAPIFKNPAVHPFSLLLGLKAEKMSKLL